MCQCVYLMLLLLDMFKILEKMNIFAFFNVCRSFTIFLSMFAETMFPRNQNFPLVFLALVWPMVLTHCNLILVKGLGL